MTSLLSSLGVHKFIRNQNNYHMLRMDTEDPASFSISQISKDSQLLSLFNQCESNDQINEQKEEVCEPSDLKPETNFNFRGYWSDQDSASQISKKTKKHRQIINKKEKRQTKKRTKLYIQMLQNRVNQLQNQNEKLRKLNKINKQYIHRLNESEHHINGYFVGRQQVFEQLENLNNQGQSNNHKIIEEIISLRIRQGSFGKDRLKAINYYFKQMTEMLLPQIQKYLIQTAIENTDFFDTNYLQFGCHRNLLQGWRKNLFESIEQDPQSQNIRKFLKQNRSRMIQESNKFRQMLENLYETKCKLIQQAKKIQEVFDGTHKYMSPKLVSKTLCYIDRYRFEKNISIEHTYSSLFEKTVSEPYSYDPENPFRLGG